MRLFEKPHGKIPSGDIQIQRIEEGDRQIQAHCPGGEIRYITGLKDKADADDWLAGRGTISSTTVVGTKPPIQKALLFGGRDLVANALDLTLELESPQWLK